MTNKTLKKVKDVYYHTKSVKDTSEITGLTESTVKRYLKGRLQTEKWLVLSDIHVPFHNRVLLDKIVYLSTKIDFTGLILNGDFLDLYSIARFNDNSLQKLKNVTLGREYEQGREVLDLLDSMGIEKKVFMYGNHEERFDRFIATRDNAKLVGALGTPEEELELEERGYELIKDYPDGYYKLGNDLEVIHGVYTNKYAAKKHLEEFKTSIIFGHTHRMQSHYEDHYAAWNIGGLYNKESEGFKYMPRAQRKKWVNGFAIVDIDEEGRHYVEMVNCFRNNFKASGIYV